MVLLLHRVLRGDFKTNGEYYFKANLSAPELRYCIIM